MIKSTLARFVFMTPVVFASVFISGCGSDDDSGSDSGILTAKEDIIKNAPLTVIIKNINMQSLGILKTVIDKTQEYAGRLKTNTFKYSGESCSSLGFSSIVSE